MQTATRKSCQNVMWKGKPYLYELNSVAIVNARYKVAKPYGFEVFLIIAINLNFPG